MHRLSVEYMPGEETFCLPLARGALIKKEAYAHLFLVHTPTSSPFLGAWRELSITKNPLHLNVPSQTLNSRSGHGILVCPRVALFSAIRHILCRGLVPGWFCWKNGKFGFCGGLLVACLTCWQFWASCFLVSLYIVDIFPTHPLKSSYWPTIALFLR